MQQISPLGPVYQAGTLSGNPLAMAAGLTTLRLISRPGFHDELTAYTTRMLDGLQQRADAAGIPSSPPRRAACSACTSAAPTPSSPSRT